MVTPRVKRARGIAVLIAVGSLLLAACTPPAPMLQPPAGSTIDDSVPEALQMFYDQDVTWEDCGGSFSCTSIEVPLDYADPTGDTIELAVKKHRAIEPDQRVSSLIINPGGPGGSGIEMVESVSSYFSADLLRRFDVVGFDPRGVGESTAVRCVDSATLDEMYSTDFDVEEDAGFDAYVESSREYGDACLEKTGPLLEHLDTISAARDLDVLRAVVGDETLNYFGFSYGTFLGATYSDLFPSRVGRLVLDGAMDPSLSYQQVVEGQTTGFDRAYRAFVQDCQAGADCPLSGDVESGLDQTIALLDQLADEPMDSGDPDRPVRDTDLVNAIIISLYNAGSWSTLKSALAAAINSDDGGQLRFLSDYAMDRDEDGNYPDDAGAFQAIDCLDYPVELDRDAIRAEADRLEGVSDLFGPYLGYGEIGCATMPFQSTAVRQEIHAPTAAPIVVIGTTRDPATPYEWAESLAAQLDNGIFIGFDGDGHTAYGGGDCVGDAVDAFLLEGTLPQDGLSC